MTAGTSPTRVFFLASTLAATLFACVADTVTTEVEETEFLGEIGAPSTVQLLASEAGIDVSWQDNSDDETGFEVHRSIAESASAPATFELLASTNAGVTSYDDSEPALDDGSYEFCYKVRAIRGTGDDIEHSAFSESKCTKRLGSLRVTSETTGPKLDPDGYLVDVSVSGRSVAAGPIDGNGTATFEGLRPVGHRVSLRGVASNCVVTGENPRTFDVSVGATAEVTFSVSCEDDVIEVSAVTTGVDPDPDGYSVQLWRLAASGRVDAGSATVAADGAAAISGLISGSYELEVRDVAVNCVLSGSNPVAVDLTVEDEAFVEVQVECEPVTQLAFVGDADGNSEIYLTSSNGTGTTALTQDLGQDRDPAWSPDGGKLAFATDRDGDSEIYVMKADGTDATRLTDHPAWDYQPTWSPDGARIAFVSQRDDPYGDLYAMDSDGANIVPLYDTPTCLAHPDWSPDGGRIAFSVGCDNNKEIYVVDADGSDPTRLTANADEDDHPAWSPDGTKIAFARGCSFSYCQRDIYVMNADGTDPTSLETGVDDDSDPSWSPDGGWIAFASRPCSYYYYYCGYAVDEPPIIKAVTADGTRVEQITSAPAHSPAWRH